MRTCASCRRRCFNPPTPCGVGRDAQHSGRIADRFQSTHPVRGGTDDERQRAIAEAFQSTHPVRGGTRSAAGISSSSAVSIHPPRAGWDAYAVGDVRMYEGFQSTHPVRGGTSSMQRMGCTLAFQSTHPVRGGTPRSRRSASRTSGFQSTHPVRGGTIPPFPAGSGSSFQSTHPVRGGTSAGWPRAIRRNVSIHPPRAGWDPVMCFTVNTAVSRFNPPTPCGVGLSIIKADVILDSFNPPTPCGVGPALNGQTVAQLLFQSTHPVRGGTCCPVAMCYLSRCFNPPTPCGVGRCLQLSSRQKGMFQSTHPVRGGT